MIMRDMELHPLAGGGIIFGQGRGVPIEVRCCKFQ